VRERQYRWVSHLVIREGKEMLVHRDPHPLEIIIDVQICGRRRRHCPSVEQGSLVRHRAPKSVRVSGTEQLAVRSASRKRASVIEHGSPSESERERERERTRAV
jgi:hypothetical protein